MDMKIKPILFTLIKFALLALFTIWTINPPIKESIFLIALSGAITAFLIGIILDIVIILISLIKQLILPSIYWNPEEFESVIGIRKLTSFSVMLFIDILICLLTNISNNFITVFIFISIINTAIILATKRKIFI